MSWKEFLDNIVQFPQDYEVVDSTQGGNVKTITPAEGTVTQSGTPLLASLLQAIQNEVIHTVDDTGVANAYACALSGLNAYFKGLKLSLTVSNNNTGASTIDVESLGVQNIKKIVSGSKVDVFENDIKGIVTLEYDGVDFVLLDSSLLEKIDTTTTEILEELGTVTNLVGRSELAQEGFPNAITDKITDYNGLINLGKTVSQLQFEAAVTPIYENTAVGQRFDSTFTANIRQINYYVFFLFGLPANGNKFTITIYDETAATTIGQKEILHKNLKLGANLVLFDSPILTTPGNVLQIRINTNAFIAAITPQVFYTNSDVLSNSFQIFTTNNWASKTDYTTRDSVFILNYSESDLQGKLLSNLTPLPNKRFYGTHEFDVFNLNNNDLNVNYFGTVESDTAITGTSNTITLSYDSASQIDDFYNDYIVKIVGGTGVGQYRIVTDYVGSTRVATVDSAWSINPDSTSEYSMCKPLPEKSVSYADATENGTKVVSLSDVLTEEYSNIEILYDFKKDSVNDSTPFVDNSTVTTKGSSDNDFVLLRRIEITSQFQGIEDVTEIDKLFEEYRDFRCIINASAGSSSDGYLWIRINEDAGNNYMHYNNDDDGGTPSTVTPNDSKFQIRSKTYNDILRNNVSGGGVNMLTKLIFNINSINDQYKIMDWEAYFSTVSGVTNMFKSFGYGAWWNNDKINAFSFISNQRYATGSTFEIYGRK